MKDYRKKRIVNCDFSVRFINIAKDRGFKCVGSFEKHLLSLGNPNARLDFRGTHVRAKKFLQEINAFKSVYMNS